MCEKCKNQLRYYFTLHQIKANDIYYDVLTIDWGMGQEWAFEM